MLKMSIEEMTALNLLLHFTTVKELITKAMEGCSDEEQELADLFWKVLKTLQD